jgi:hydrogenase-4 component E
VTGLSDLLLLLAIVADLYVVASSRLTGCIRASAIQGIALGLVPIAFWWEGSTVPPLHAFLMGLGLLLLKGVLIPALLLRALRKADVRHEVESTVSVQLSILLATVLIGFSFWFSRVLVLPQPAPSVVVVPAALATLLTGFLILVSRRKAITQVVGYLFLENGVSIFGQTVAREIPFAAELAILLDLLVAVFVMGIAIHHISREFDHIDTDRLSSLRG